MAGPTEPQADRSTIDLTHDGGREFVLRKLDNDLFMRTGKQIIDACELQIGFEAWKQNMADLWEEIREFAARHQPQVTSVYMLPRAGAVQVLYVTPGKPFDFELADDLAEWNLRLRRQRGMYGEVEASQIPEGELSQFVEQGIRADALKA